jgi:hypothetical protein
MLPATAGLARGAALAMRALLDSLPETALLATRLCMVVAIVRKHQLERDQPAARCH